MNITQQQYEQLKDLKGTDLEEKALELNLVSVVDIIGYGIKYIKVFQKNGEYYFDYDIYNSCD